MILSSQNLLHYLLSRGLLEPEAVVDGDVTIAEISRRHRNFKVLRRQGPGLFVKQAKDLDPLSGACLRREGACCRLAAEDPGFAPLRRHLPGFRDFDSESGTLVVDLIAGAEGLADFHQRSDGFPPEIGGELGRCLGELHADLRADLASPPYREIFPAHLPPILTLHRAASGFAALGPAAAHLAALLSSDRALCQALDALGACWRHTALIHGDVKWDNCLRLGGELRLVDWELADWGDPAWDAGAVFQAYLAQWVWSMTPQPAPAATLVAQARAPLAQLRPALASFWQTYRGARALSAAAERSELLLCLRCAGARMFQTSFESATFEGRLTPPVFLLAQLGRNVLLHPHAAARQLLEM